MSPGRRVEQVPSCMGADVAAVVRGLKIEQAVLVGHSMGGPVALAAAPKLRGILRGIVVVDSGGTTNYGDILLFIFRPWTASWAGG